MHYNIYNSFLYFPSILSNVFAVLHFKCEINTIFFKKIDFYQLSKSAHLEHSICVKLFLCQDLKDRLKLMLGTMLQILWRHISCYYFFHRNLCCESNFQINKMFYLLSTQNILFKQEGEYLGKRKFIFLLFEITRNI